jgi:thiol-disulfide isomerase/thioredoxin
MKKTFIFLVSLILFNGCKVEINKNDYLRTVLANLEQIESANYFSTFSGSAPGDTIEFVTYKWYVKEYFNPVDTFIGSTIAKFQPMDTTKMFFYYDGLAKAYINTDLKTIEIDSFQTNRYPFRLIIPPFFNFTKSIIKYALETKDSISTDLKDFGDSLLFSLAIYDDNNVEFFGSPFPIGTGNGISRYDIWIGKSVELPYRYRRSMSSNTSWETCRNVTFNNAKIENFIPSKYFPPDFEIVAYGKGKPVKNDLTGEVATDWSLQDINDKTISLKDIKSKVIMIQFTGIGCGPCHASIPFLKKLVYEYDNKDFELVCIETWSKNIDGIKRYYNNNDLNYNFLLSTVDISTSYKVQSVPVFLILDKNRVIKKVINGYGKGTTDKEIRDAINKLI